ncbi:acyltransferase family protein [Soonwooa sp.]|uniref:acyltransferase family protein n=1 Tax=Soonwooa sp. TaxID=1938592 RepID=UPI0028AD3770|nr:acyltransferase family protein [Soonwooa sp.]
MSKKAQISITQSNQLKSIAILMMLFLHLFNRNPDGLFRPLIFIGSQPLSYYLSLFCDACVPIFAFVSGYGLYFKYKSGPDQYKSSNKLRLKKLYLILWIIILLFPVILGLLLNPTVYPGSFWKIIGNLSGLQMSYNGAWWFFTTYVFFILTSKFWFQLFDRVNPYTYFIVLLVLYFGAFYFRVYKNDLFDSALLNWGHRQLALYFCTLFQFMMGAFALEYQWHNRTSQVFKSLPGKNIFVIVLISGLVVIHALVPSFIIASFLGLAFIFLYLQLDMPVFLSKALRFFEPHATNIWLVHMFFYLIFFSDFVYSFHYVPFIFIILLTVCIVSSYFINLISKPLLKLI